jgi:acetyl-CoA carboxylase biotin carboxyl carrier protein
MDDKTLLALVEKFSAGDIAELQLSDGAVHLALRKASAVAAAAAGQAAGAAAAAAPAAAPPAAAAAAAAVQPVHLGLPAKIEEAPAAAPAGAAAGEAIVSPIVATFYRSPGPDAPAFAEVGAKIKAGQTLCILEAMKMMNHLEAEFDCEILAVKAANGDLVEYGQTLFEVKRA